MLTSKTLTIMLLLSFFMMTTMSIAKDFIIFNISQDLPMGEENEVIKKNYYINIGNEQGVKKGTLLDVYRNVSKLDPYENKKRYNYKIKIGELKVLHSERGAAIGKLEEFFDSNNSPLINIYDFMVGDQVKVHIKK